MGASRSVALGRSDTGRRGRRLRQANIALRQSHDAQHEARQGQIDRLVDHEVSRRRECIDALSQLWGAMVGMGIDFLTFTQYLDDLTPNST